MQVTESIGQQIADAVGHLAEQLGRHPERRIDVAEDYAMRGEARPYPVIYLGRQADISAGEVMERRPVPRLSPEERLLGNLRGMTNSLAMLNPIRPRVGLGIGIGSLPAAFGLQIDEELGYSPIGSIPIDELLERGVPDTASSGYAHRMREDIEAALAYTPEWMEIGPPDMQGPFNIAHMLLGDDAFIAPHEEPDKFHRLMSIITDFYMATDALMREWIGARFPKFPGSGRRIAECSVNLVSTQFYLDFILRHDRRIVDHYGTIGIHPCSGPHVFYATLRSLPNVVYTEAGAIDRAAAGAITVADALKEVGDRTIILSIGQELPEGREEEFIRRDLDLARENPRLLFGYTGMHWKKRDEDAIRDLHLRLDDYWERHVRS